MNLPVLGKLGAMFAAATLVVVPACSQSPEEGPASASDRVIGGYDAAHPSYDAIGALVEILPDGSTKPFCSATLIGPSAVLSAKHCFFFVRPTMKVGFATGADAFAPNRVVPITSSEWERGKVMGAFMDLGADIAVGYLAEPITDITPIGVGGVTADDVGKKFLAVGYGEQATELLDPMEPPPDGPPSARARSAGQFFGTRKAASRTLRAVEGRYWELVYGTFEKFFEAVVAADPNGSSDPEFEKILREFWEASVLLPGYDLAFGGVEDEADVCGGDSGGPILRTVGGKWTVVGVTSGNRFIPPATPFYPCLQQVTVYSTFGPQAKHVIDAARSCGGVTQRGSCDGGQASRCTRLEEGPPRVVRSDCSAVGQVCSATPREPVCAPACRADADCDALAPGGACDSTSGQCVFTPRCADEGGAATCFVCCLGQFDEPFDCMNECAELPRRTSPRSSRMAVGSYAYPL